jgi:carotenoid cleavage dioxygenase-like enzyme
MTPPIPPDIRLMGPLKPMRFEAVVDDCIVSEGEIPEELNGGFYRVGPTWKRPTKQGTSGFVTQDGMVQSLVFREGRADFRNKWIRTPKYVAEERAGRGLFEWADGDFGDWRSYGLGEVLRDEFTHGIPQGNNAVNVFPFAGQIVASGEMGSPPIALDPITLETIGVVPWSVALGKSVVDPACFGDGAFTAHPKWDPDSGELYGWGYSDEKPYTTLHWVKPDGSIRSRELWDAPYNALTHDMWLSDAYVVLPFQPFTVDRTKIGRDLSLFGWEPDKPIVLALIKRDDFDGPIRWIEAGIDPQYIMHTMAPNQDGSKLILDGPIFDRPPFPFEDEVELGIDFVPFGTGQIGRWVLDLESGKVTSERLDDRAVEFPKVDERFYGKPYQWGFMVAGENLWTLNTIVRRNVVTGAEDAYTITRDDDVPLAVFEPTFAPRSPEAPEGDGYLIAPVSRFTENFSEFLIFDTQHIPEGPVAAIELPFQMGWTPHGHWMDFRGKQLPSNGNGRRASVGVAMTGAGA